MNSLILSLLSAGVTFVFSVENNDSYRPGNGFVPDSATAIGIAEAVCKPIYGEDAMSQQRPLTAKLANDEWTVTGTVPGDRLGGGVIVRISKKDGKILSVTHEK